MSKNQTPKGQSKSSKLTPRSKQLNLNSSKEQLPYETPIKGGKDSGRRELPKPNRTFDGDNSSVASRTPKSTSMFNLQKKNNAKQKKMKQKSDRKAQVMMRRTETPGNPPKRFLKRR